MILRLANHNDIDQLIRMRWDFTNEYIENKIAEDQFPNFYLECKSFLTDAFKSNNWFIWVAGMDGQIVSHIYIELIHKVPRPGRVTNPFTYMTNVYTLPEHRGKGIGSQLLKEIEVWAKQKRYEFIIVWPSDWSIEFYERNGYKPIGEAMELKLE